MENRALLNLIACLVLILSTSVFIFQLIQIGLYNDYAKKASLPGLIQSGYKPYFVWIATFCVSFVSSSLVGFVCWCCYCGCSTKFVIQLTRLLSGINVLMTTAALLYVTLASETEPYSAGLVDFTRPAKGYISYCSLLNQENDKYYPSLYHRCWVYNLTWFGNIALVVSWIILLIVGLLNTEGSRRHNTADDYVTKLEQHNEHLINTQRSYPMSNNSSYNRPRKYSEQSFVTHSRAGSMQALMERHGQQSIYHAASLPPMNSSPTANELSDVENEVDTLLPPMPEQPYHSHPEYFSTTLPIRPPSTRTRSIPLTMTTIQEQEYSQKYRTA